MDGGTAETRLAAWMAAAQRGDGEAYRMLLRACLPIIAAAARGQGVRNDRVDDVVQETLLTIHRARATYDPARPFLPWLRAIAERRLLCSQQLWLWLLLPGGTSRRYACHCLGRRQSKRWSW